MGERCGPKFIHATTPRAQDALSLPGRQAKHQAQGDRRLDGVVRVLALSAWRPARRPRRVPVGERAIGESEPDGQTPARAETRLVLPPIPDTGGLLDVLLLGAVKRVMRDLGSRGGGQLLTEIASCAPRHVHTLTEKTGDDATTAVDLLTAVEDPLVRVTADAAYDAVAVYETATARGATVVIPPARTANVSGHGPRSPARDRTIMVVKTLGRRRWKKVSGYHRQGRVENTFFRHTSIIGDVLRARRPAGQGSEAVLGCEILNRMTALGRPVSYRVRCV